VTQEIGKKLGEMWNKLGEDGQKVGFRNVARVSP
jgi:hypothetical protein